MRISNPTLLSLLSAGLVVAVVGAVGSPTPQPAAAGVAALPSSALATTDVAFAAMWPQPMICPPPPLVYGGNVTSSNSALADDCVFDRAAHDAAYAAMVQGDLIAPPPPLLAYGNLSYDPAHPGGVRDQVFDVSPRSGAGRGAARR